LDISLTSTGWQDIDLSLLVPADATGVVVEIANTHTGNIYRGVLRGKEDTRDYMSNTSYNAISELNHRYQIVKLDSNLCIEGYIDNTSVDFRLIGYTSGADPPYFASPPQISPTAGGWTTVDVSGQVDADADGVILFIQNQDNSNRLYGMRELTSGDITLGMRNYRSRMHVVGLDADKKFEAYIETTGVKIYLVGQTKGSVVYYTNNVAVTDPTTGSWQTRDADNYGVADEATGLFLSVWNTSGRTDMSFQHGDSSDNYTVRKLNGDQGFQAPAGLNDANLWGEYMGNTSMDVYIAAYTSGGGSWMATGTYTGDGVAGKAITGVGFQPDMVIVKRYPKVKGEVRTSTMPAGESKSIQSSDALWNDHIESLDTDGFTVGYHSDKAVNKNGDTYYWVAIKEVSGLSKFGSYTGDDVDYRSITGVGFQPDYVMVFPDANSNSVHRMSSMTGDATMRFDASGFSSDKIKALESDGFQVGRDVLVNAPGVVYHYAAFKSTTGTMAVGTYAGDDNDDRDITAGFQPDWVIVDSDSNVSYPGGGAGPMQRFAAMSGDISVNFSWANPDFGVFVDCIQSFNVSGFQVGTESVVNSGTVVYHWAAFTDTLATASGKPRIVRWVEVDPYY